MQKKIFLLIAFFLLLMLGYFYFQKNSLQNENLLSRKVLEYAMDIVRREKPTPPESARFYAIISTLYQESLQNGQVEAVNTSLEMVNFMYPTYVASTTEFFKKNNIAKIDFENLNISSKENISKMKARLAHDASIKKDLSIFNHPEHWDKKLAGGKEPFSPAAGEWERWLNTENFTVPEPPVYKSAQFYSELQKVKDAAENRNSEQVALINFWGGIPGTEQPAGIWLNRLYQEYLVFNKNKISEKDFAFKQKILAQSLADGFINCWKTKYTFFTKRPNMTDPSIKLAMPNPPFPSYVSGHSTVSFVAATVLCGIFKENCDEWMSDAQNAKNSRLWAGIHFDYDNEEGKNLGIKVGNNILENIK
jgi:hypothetical protein